jgi:hypothetical protein
MRVGERRKEKQWHISLGGGIHLAPEQWYIDFAFTPPGGPPLLTVEGFRKFCRVLHVPMVHIGEDRFVDMHRFQLAVSAICRVGEKDFAVPGCEALRRARPEGMARELDMKRFVTDYRRILQEMLVAKECSGVRLTRDVRETAQRAANRMVQAALQTTPAGAQHANGSPA